jgi:hypothetical protein
MPSYLLSERQLKKILETAQDLDRYIQPLGQPSDNGHGDVQDTLKSISDKSEELLSMIKGGKKVPTELQSKFHEFLDNFDKIYSLVKYED